MSFASRRAFLTGRRTAQTPWQAFCQRVQRSVAGDFLDYGFHDGEGSARLIPGDAADVHRARAACAEFGVALALEGLNQPAAHTRQSVLWLELGRNFSQVQRLQDDPGKWFVQAGCTLGELAAAGLPQFASLPGYTAVAAWLADRSYQAWKPGRTHLSGVVHARFMLADGSAASLGWFGESNRQPLDSLTLQRLIPSLFQLIGLPESRACLAAGNWPARYRLDALSPEAGHTVNLAHLLLGHGGDLAWLEWVVIDEAALAPAVDPDPAGFSLQRQAADTELAAQAAELDSRVKALFDPQGLFSHPGQEL